MEYSSSTGIPVVYWFFYVLLIAILGYCGYGMGYKRKHQWKKYARFAILSYALIEGLRWLRGADYYSYYYFFETGKEYIEKKQGMEVLFSLFGQLFSFLKIYPPIAFIILSALLCLGNVLIYKDYKKAAFVGLPLMFLIYGSTSAENIVRQYCAISFLMVAYYFYVCNKKTYMYICLACMPFIHFSSLLVIVLFLILINKSVPFNSPVVFTVIYVLLYFFWDVHWLDSFADFLMSLNMDFGEDFYYRDYLNNIDKVITTEGSIALALGRAQGKVPIIIKIPQFLTEVSIIYFGFEACKKDMRLHVVYYFAFLGILIKMIAGDIEILSRFALYFNWMEPFLAGLIFCNINYCQKQWLKPALTFIFAVNFLFFGLLIKIGSLPYAGCGFIWDK